MIIVTTSYDPDILMKNTAIKIAADFSAEYLTRKKLPLAKILPLSSGDGVIVVEKENIKYYSNESDQPFFFHPSMAILRINRIQQGDNDIMVQAAGLKAGDSFLDCTFGLGADSLVASYVTGAAGKVVGFESQTILAKLVKIGLQRGWKEEQEIDAAMKRIELRNVNHLDGLRQLPDKSFDIVYFDPMFKKGVNKSISINSLRGLANNQSISLEALDEAKRVAKRRIILKENRYSNEFERLGFEPLKRSSSITYGVIMVDGADLT